VAARVVTVKPAVPGHQLGDLMIVSVERLECTAEEGRPSSLRSSATRTSSGAGWWGSITKEATSLESPSASLAARFRCSEQMARVAWKCYNVPTESTFDAAHVAALLH
jgi:hypothetical protein